MCQAEKGEVIKKTTTIITTTTANPIDSDNRMVITRGKGEWEGVEDGMGLEGSKW